MSSDRHTQAVIFIHGIGEQVPMGTVRDFVEEVLPPQPDNIKYFSRPDNISDTYELRILQDRNQPRTHFFEYYWAYKIEGTTFGHIFSWLKTLLLRSPFKITPQLLPLYIISWGLIALTLLAFAFGWVEEDLFKLSGVTALVFSAVQGYVLKSAGDAARYLSPTPTNIKLRQQIRKDGIDMVKRIMEKDKYERIVIVGHSLGSVIGYDILKHLWQEFNKDYQQPRKQMRNKTQEEIKKLTKKQLQPALAKLEAFGDSELWNQPGQLDAYRQAQRKLWKELRGMGNPWLITDFVTLGSPLSLAATLLAKDQEDLELRQMQRELPTCPPVREPDDSFSYKSWDDYEYGRKKYKPWVLHHAGLFGPTRWTNLYFPALMGLFGDIIGGPMRPLFGPGIKDIAVSTGKLLRDRTLAAHSSYWPGGRSGTQVELYLQHLIDALDLDNEEIFELE